jgi:hypothetical protein
MVTAGAILTTLAVIGFAWWLAAWVRNDGKLLRSETQLTEQLRSALVSRDRALDLEQNKTTKLKSALSTVEKQRDAAIENLATMGDPDGIAAGIRSELERVRALSTDPAPEDS